MCDIYKTIKQYNFLEEKQALELKHRYKVKNDRFATPARIREFLEDSIKVAEYPTGSAWQLVTDKQDHIIAVYELPEDISPEGVVKRAKMVNGDGVVLCSNHNGSEMTSQSEKDFLQATFDRLHAYGLELQNFLICESKSVCA